MDQKANSRRQTRKAVLEALEAKILLSAELSPGVEAVQAYGQFLMARSLQARGLEMDHGLSGQSTAGRLSEVSGSVQPLEMIHDRIERATPVRVLMPTGGSGNDDRGEHARPLPTTDGFGTRQTGAPIGLGFENTGNTGTTGNNQNGNGTTSTPTNGNGNGTGSGSTYGTDDGTDTTDQPVRHGADLSVTNVRAVASGTHAGNLELTWTVKNVGDRGSEREGWQDEAYYSLDRTLDLDGRDTYLGTWWAGAYAPLPAGAEYTMSRYVPMPESAIGEGYIIVVTDRLNRQSEIGEQNNVGATRRTIQPNTTGNGPTTGTNGGALLPGGVFAEAEKEALKQGLTLLSNWANDLSVFDQLGRPISMLAEQAAGLEAKARTLGELIGSFGTDVGVGAILREALAGPALSYLNGVGTLTAQGLATVFETQAQTLGAVNWRIETAGGRNELVYTLNLSTSKTLTDAKFNLATQVNTPQINLNAQVNLNASGSLNGTFELGLDLDAIDPAQAVGAWLNQAFFVRQLGANPLASLTANATATNVNFKADVGFMEASVTNGTATLNAIRELRLVNTDGDAFGRITLGELRGTPLADLVTLTRPGSGNELNVSLPMSGSIGSYNLQLGAATATINITDNSVLDGVAPVATATNFNADVDLYSTITSTDWTALLSSLASGLTRLGSGEAMQVNVPFLGTTSIVPSSKFADLIDFGKGLRDRILSFVEQTGPNGQPTPSFSTFQGFTRLLAQTLGVSESSLLPAFDTVTKRLTLRVQFEQTLVNATLPLNVDFDLAPIGGFSSTGSLAVTAKGRLEFTLGIDLSRLGVGFQTRLVTQFPQYTTFDLVPLGLVNDDRGVRGLESNGTPDLRLVNRAGQTALVTLDGLTTVGQVQQAINAAGASINVSALLTTTTISPANTQTRFSIRLIDGTLTGDAVFRVEAMNDSLALIDLGLTEVDTDGNGIIDGKSLHGESWFSRMFVQNASAVGSITAGNALDINQQPIPVSASFRVGFLGVNATNIVGQIAGSVSIQVADLGSNTSDGITYITDLAEAGANAAISPGISGSASLNVGGLTVNGGFISVDPGAGISISLPNLRDLAQKLIAPNVLAERLFDLKQMAIDSALGALYSALDYLQNAASVPLLTNKLPLLNRSIMDLISNTSTGDVQKFVDQVRSVVNAVQTANVGTIQQLAPQLNLALGLTGNSVVSYNETTKVLDLVLNYDKRLSGSVPIDFSLGSLGLPGLGDVVDATANGSLTYNARVSLVLDVAIGLENPLAPVVYLRDNTGFNAYALLQASNLELSLSAGPFALYAGRPGDQGSVYFNKLGTPSALPTGPNDPTTDWATFGVNIADLTNPGPGQLPGLYPLSSLTTSVVQVAAQGAVTATLPLYFRNPLSGAINIIDTNQRNLVLTSANLTTPSLNVVAPNLASIFTGGALTAFSGLSEGLGAFLARLDAMLSVTMLATKLPVVGDRLNNVVQVFTDLRNSINNIRTLIDSQIGLVAAQVQQIIFDALGPASSVPLLKDRTGDNQVTIADVGLTASSDGVDFDILLGQTLTFNQSLQFDLGLPSVGLSVDSGNVTLTADYSLRLAFGASTGRGFYIKTEAGGQTPELSVNVQAAIPNFSATGKLGILKVNLADISTNPTLLNIAFKVNVKDANSDGFLTLTELNNPPSGDIKNLFAPNLTGRADARLRITTSLGAPQLPSFRADLIAGWGLDWNFTTGLVGSAPTLAFENVALDVGQFLNFVAAPILDRINQITRPIRPLLNVLTQRVPVISDLYGRDVDLLTLSEWFAKPGTNITSTRQFIDAVKTISSTLPGLISAGSGQTLLNLGNLNISSLGVDLRSASTSLSALNVSLQNAPTSQQVISALTTGSASSTFANAYRGLSGGGFSFPIIEGSTEVFSLLMGKDATFFKYTTPKLSAGFSFTQFFPIFGPLGARLTAGLDIAAQFSFGYDTFGARQFLASNFTNVAALAKGFYVSDVDSMGKDVAEVTLRGEVKLAAELNIDLGIFKVNAGVSGGIVANITVDLSNSFDDGDGDNTKIRIMQVASNPLQAFTLSGSIYAELEAYLKVTFTLDLGFYSKTWTVFDFNYKIARVTLFTFSIGSGGNDASQYDPNPDVASVSGNTLTLNMTASGDNFLVERTGANSYKVTGNGTVETFTSVTITNIVASAGNGDDVLVVQGTGGFTMAAALNFTGGAGADNLKYLGTGNVTATGGDGNDTLTADGGVDDLSGDAGNDTLVAGAGATNTLRGGTDDDTLTGGTGIDSIFGDAGADTIEGGDGNDILEGGAGDDQITGGIGNDTIRGQADNDTLDGGDGNDDIFGGTGNDRILGGAGNDHLFGEDGDDDLSAGDGDDTLDSGIGNNRLSGGGGNDDLIGNVGNDSLDGGAGSDWIVGGAGDDNIIAGTGVDFIWGDGVAPGATRATFPAGNTAGLPTLPGALSGISGGFASSAGTDGNDIIDGGADDSTDWIFSTGGDDTIDGAGGHDYLDAGNGADVLRGGAGQDRMLSGAGADIAMGGRGDDNILGQGDDDRMYGGQGPDAAKTDGSELDTGNDTLSGGLGKDEIDGGDGNDSISGNEDNDTLIGGRGADNITGDAGNDLIMAGLAGATGGLPIDTQVNTVDGGSGLDTIFGDDGNDILGGGSENDTIRGLGGADTISGGAGADALFGDAGGDTIFGGTTTSGGSDALVNTVSGGDGDDFIYGDSGADVLSGDDGNDTIQGNAGADTIDGGRNNDIITGGDGNDTLRGGFGSDNVDGGNNDDVIFGGLVEVGGGDTQANTLTGGGGVDFIYGDAGVDNINGGAQDDVIFGNDGADIIFGGTENDVIFGGRGGDTISGEAGSDSLYAGRTLNGDGDTAANTVDGNDGIDLIFGDGGNDTLRGGLGADTIFGRGGNDIIEGNADVDVLSGDAGNDTLYGGAGSDTLDGGANIDTLIGGSEADRLILDLSAPGGNEILQGHGVQDAANTPAPGTNTTDTDILQISSNTGNGDDVITIGRPNGSLSTSQILEVNFNGAIIPAEWRETDGTPRFEQFQIDLGGGTNSLEFLSGVNVKLDLDYLARTDVAGRPFRSQSEMVVVVTGGPGRDLIIGSDARDYLQGGAGDDYIFGGLGDDRLWGDEPSNGPSFAGPFDGNDFVYTTNGNDDAFGQGGVDAMFATLRSVEANLISTGAVRTALLSGNLSGIDMIGLAVSSDIGYNRLHAGAGSDTLYGGYGADFLYGGDGSGDNDVLFDRNNVSITNEGQAEAWLTYGRTLDRVWYVSGTDAAEEFQVDYLTGSPITPLVGTTVIRLKVGASTTDLFNVTFNAVIPNTSTPIWTDPANALADPGLLTFSQLQINNDYDVIIIDAAGGDDVVEVSSTVRKSVWVAGGQGNDVINMDQANAFGQTLTPGTTLTSATLQSTISSSAALKQFLGLPPSPSAPQLAAAAAAWLVDITNRRDISVGGLGDDTIAGGPGEDWIFGGAGDDILFGGIDAQMNIGGTDREIVDRSDLIEGGDGNDAFQIIPQLRQVASNAYDQVFGGAGLDQAIYDGSYTGGNTTVVDYVLLGYDSTTGPIGSGVYQVGALLRSPTPADNTGSTPPTYNFLGSGGNPYVRTSRFVPSNIEALVINTRGGNDTVFADTGRTLTTVSPGNANWGISRTNAVHGANIPNLLILGGDGVDQLFGSGQNDSIYGEQDNDYIRGFEGSDLIAGDGDPLNAASGGNDYIVGDDNTSNLPLGITNPPLLANRSITTVAPTSLATANIVAYEMLSRNIDSFGQTTTQRTFGSAGRYALANPVQETPLPTFNPTPNQSIPLLAGSNGQFLTKQGTPGGLGTQTFDNTSAGLTSSMFVDSSTTERWFQFTTLGDGGAALGEPINAERDRNFITLSPDSYSRTLVASANSGTITRTGATTSSISLATLQANSHATPVVGIMEFDISALLGEPEDLTSATLTLQATWTSSAGETLRNLDLYLLPGEGDFGVTGTTFYTQTSGTDLGPANLVRRLALPTQNGTNAVITTDLTDIVRAVLESGRTRFTLRVETQGRSVAVSSIQQPNREANTVTRLEMVQRQSGVLGDIYNASGQLVASGRSVIDMRLMKAGKYFLRVYTPEGAAAPRSDFAITITPPAQGFAHPATFRDTIDGGPGDDQMTGGIGLDSIQGGAGSDIGVGETAASVNGVSVSEFTSNITTDVETKLAPSGADPDLVAAEPMVVDPTVTLDARLYTAQPNGASTGTAMSADGRYIAFASYANNLVTGDQAGRQDVFVYDRTTQTTERVSVGVSGAEANGNSFAPKISNDGRYVVFVSAATNLGWVDLNGKNDVYLYDRSRRATTLVSTQSLSGNSSNGISGAPDISGDGTLIAFESTSTNIVSGTDTNNKADVFTYELATGVRTRITAAGGGAAGGGYGPSVSTTGEFIAFTSTAPLVAGDTNNVADIFRFQRTGSVTTRINLNTVNAQLSVASDFASISGDGNRVAFSTRGVIGLANNGHENVFYRDITGNSTVIVSFSTALDPIADARFPSFSADGNFVAYTSTSANVVGGDTNGIADVFVYNISGGTTTRASVTAAGAQANAAGAELFLPVVSNGGTVVAFETNSTALSGQSSTAIYMSAATGAGVINSTLASDLSGVLRVDAIRKGLSDVADTRWLLNLREIALGYNNIQTTTGRIEILAPAPGTPRGALAFDTLTLNIPPLQSVSLAGNAGLQGNTVQGTATWRKLDIDSLSFDNGWVSGVRTNGVRPLLSDLAANQGLGSLAYLSALTDPGHNAFRGTVNNGTFTALQVLDLTGSDTFGANIGTLPALHTFVATRFIEAGGSPNTATQLSTLSSALYARTPAVGVYTLDETRNLKINALGLPSTSGGVQSGLTSTNANTPTVLAQFDQPVYTPQTGGIFGSASTLSASSNPRSMLSADLNLDGILDLAVANFGANTVSVYNGTGTGAFAAAVNYAVGTSPISITSGDFNADGRQDLLVANSGGSNVSVLLANSGGTFNAATTVATNPLPRGLAVGDFNRDGRADFVVSYENLAQFQYFQGNGNGTFITGGGSVVGATPVAALSGDFDRDGDLDIITANYGAGTLTLRVNNGSANFTTSSTITVGTNPIALASGDFNRDGRLDIVVASEAGNTAQVLLSNGAGTFAAPVNFNVGTLPSSVSVSDVNFDGALDIIVGSSSGGNGVVSYLLGNGTGAFQAAETLAAQNGTAAVVVGDFNRDGQIDLAAANRSASTLSVFLNVAPNQQTGFSSLSTTLSSTGTSPRAVAVADFNKDGRPDYVVSNSGSSFVTVHLNQGGGAFTTGTFGLSNTAHVVNVGDFNLDGNIDIVAAQALGNVVSFLAGNGAGSFSAAVNTATVTGPRSLAVGDMNLDGRPDLVVSSGSGNTVSVMLGNGSGGFGAPSSTIGVGGFPFNYIIADLNNDGKPDAVGPNNSTNSISVLIGNGTGGFSSNTSFATGTGPAAIAAGDLNGDGRLDLITANGTSSTLSVLISNGSGTFAAAVSIPTLGGGSGLAIADFTGDGKLDLAHSNSSVNLVRVMTGNGDGTFGTTATYSTGTGPLEMTAADFNTDGRPDIVVVNNSGANSTVLTSINPSVQVFTPGQTELAPRFIVTGPSGVVAGVTLSGSGSRQIAVNLPAGLPEGSYTVTLSGSLADDYRNYLGSSQTFTFSIDRSAPTVALALPLNGDNRSTVPTTIDVQWTDTGLAGIDPTEFGVDDITINGLAPTGFTSLGSGLVRYNVPAALLGLTNNQFTIAALAGGVKDRAGNTVAAGTVGQFIVDTTAPSGQLSFPAPTAILGTSPTFIDILWNDAGSGINPATLGTNDLIVTDSSGVVPISGVPVLQGGGAWRYSFTRAIVDGSVSVQSAAAGVADRSGNASVLASLGSFVVDTQAVAASVVNPSGSFTLDQGFIDVQWNTGSGSALNAASIDISDITVTQGANNFPVVAVLPVVGQTNTFRYFYSGQLADGPVTVTAIANQVSDTAGNNAAAGVIAVRTLDRAGPVATLTANGALTANLPATIDVLFTDLVAINPATIQSADLLFNVSGLSATGSPAALGGNVFRFALTLAVGSTYTSGPITVSIAAGSVADMLGNLNLAATVGTFSVDKSGPVATLNTPAAGSTLSTAINTIRVQLSDPTGVGLNAASVAASDFAVDGATISGIAQVPGSPGLYELTLTAGLPDGPGVVRVVSTILDLFGNSTPLGIVGSFLIDRAAPVATLQPRTYADIDDSPDARYVDVHYTDAGFGVDFSTAGLADVTLRNATTNQPIAVTGFQVLPNGIVRYFHAPITPTILNNTTLFHTIEVTRGAGRVADLGGNTTSAPAVVGTFLFRTARARVIIIRPNLVDPTPGGNPTGTNVDLTRNTPALISTPTIDPESATAPSTQATPSFFSLSQPSALSAGEHDAWFTVSESDPFASLGFFLAASDTSEHHEIAPSPSPDDSSFGLFSLSEPGLQLSPPTLD